jgi:hypothetical protein
MNAVFDTTLLHEGKVLRQDDYLLATIGDSYYRHDPPKLKFMLQYPQHTVIYMPYWRLN